MIKKKIEEENITILVQYFIISLIYIRELILLFFNQSPLVSGLFYGLIICIGIWALMMFLSKKITCTSENCIFLIFIGILFLCFLIKGSGTNGAMASTLGRGLIVFLFLNLSLNRAQTNEKVLHYNACWNIALVVALFIQSFDPNSYISNQLCFSYLNPNSTGLSAYLCFLNLVVYLFTCKETYMKIALGVSAVLSLYLCIISNSRSALFSLILFVALMVLFLKKKNNHRLYIAVLRVAIGCLIAYPCIWVVFYAIVRKPDLMFFGKPLFTYRELIWNEMFIELLNNPIISRLGEALKKGSGAHNVLLAVWWDYGVFAAILFCWLLYIFFDRLCKKIKSNLDIVLLAALLSTFFSMSLEVLLFSGGVDFMFRVFYLAAFIGLGERKNNEQRLLRRERNE